MTENGAKETATARENGLLLRSGRFLLIVLIRYLLVFAALIRDRTMESGELTRDQGKAQ